MLRANFFDGQVKNIINYLDDSLVKMVDNLNLIPADLGLYLLIL